MIFPRVFAAALAITVVAIVAMGAASIPAALAAGAGALDIAAFGAFALWTAAVLVPMTVRAIVHGAAE
jgi:hypothetical protein